MRTSRFALIVLKMDIFSIFQQRSVKSVLPDVRDAHHCQTAPSASTLITTSSKMVNLVLRSAALGTGKSQGVQIAARKSRKI